MRAFAALVFAAVLVSFAHALACSEFGVSNDRDSSGNSLLKVRATYELSQEDANSHTVMFVDAYETGSYSRFDPSQSRFYPADTVQGQDCYWNGDEWECTWTFYLGGGVGLKPGQSYSFKLGYEWRNSQGGVSRRFCAENVKEETKTFQANSDRILTISAFSPDKSDYCFRDKSGANRLAIVKFDGSNPEKYLESCFERITCADGSPGVRLKPECPYCAEESSYQKNYFKASFGDDYYYYYPKISCDANYLILLDYEKVRFGSVESALAAFVKDKRANGWKARVADLSDYKGGTAKQIQDALSQAGNPKFALIVSSPDAVPLPNEGDNEYRQLWNSEDKIAAGKSPFLEAFFGRVPFDGGQASAMLSRLTGASYTCSKPEGFYDACYDSDYTAEEFEVWKKDLYDKPSNCKASDELKAFCRFCVSAVDFRDFLFGGSAEISGVPLKCKRKQPRNDQNYECDYDFIDEKVEAADLVYFAGHGSVQGTEMGAVGARDRQQGYEEFVSYFSVESPAPIKTSAVVFSGACYAAAWGEESFARRVLSGGAKAVVGAKNLAFGDGGELAVSEGDALSAYKALKSALSNKYYLGTAVGLAWNENHEEGLQLYGDPAARICPAARAWGGWS